MEALVWGGHAAYSVLLPLSEDEGTVGVVYERGHRDPYENISIAIVKVGN